ncbi:MAG: molybdopterin-synthase adenylyltransferase MoeB [Rhodobacteraceae bacterium]|nr:MAG: molybdopterin-synthase adenylyltransferase MoeB [Paracoccaceae bacterium]
MAFTDEELERYARHIVLREIGGPGQRKLQAARVLCIGAGGLGSPALMYLAAAGVGTLGVVDDDHVSLSNLQRQVLHATDRVDAPKTESARAAIAALNPHVSVEAHAERLTAENAERLVGGYDVVLDGSDNFDTRYLLNAVCLRLDRPLVAAAIGQWEGQLSVYRRGGPCFACVFPERPAAGLAPSCAEAGVLGALAGVMGALQAAEAVKLIVGTGESLSGRLLLYDALWADFRTVTTKRRPDCPACARFNA